MLCSDGACVPRALAPLRDTDVAALKRQASWLPLPALRRR